MNSIQDIANEINARGKYVATIGQDGVMQVTTARATHTCPRCRGTGEVAEVGEVVVERVMFDPDKKTILAGNGASMAATGNVLAWIDSLHR